MRKTLPALAVVITLLLLVQLPVLALDVIVKDNGSTTIYKSQILGATTSKTKPTPQVTAKDRTVTPLKTLPANKNTQLRVIPDKGEVKLQVERKDPKQTGSSPAAILNTETLKDKQLLIEIPVGLNLTGTATSTDSAKAQQARVERLTRKTEQLVITSEATAGGQPVTTFESRAVKAKLNGAQFVLDPVTHVVTLTTPSGNVHILNHLPDQAINNMLRNGKLQLAATPALASPSPTTATATDNAEASPTPSPSPSPSASPETAIESAETGDVTSQLAGEIIEDLALEVKDDGTVTYTLTVKETKKLLGFVPRQVPVKVELDDSTGLVTQETVRSSNAFVRLLNALSY